MFAFSYIHASALTPTPASLKSSFSTKLAGRRPSHVNFHSASWKACADKTSTAPKSDKTTSLGLSERLRLLADPTLNASARQVLTIDIVSEIPKLISNARSSDTSFSRENGFADFSRQLRDDIFPDLIGNGPKFIARALESLYTPDLSKTPGSVSEKPSPPSNPISPPVRLSPAEITQEVGNVFKSTPDGLFTPDYDIVLSDNGFEVRRYPSLIVARTKMSSESFNGGDKSELEYAAAMGSSFGNLANYLFGKNKDSTAMKMTTPVLMDRNNATEVETVSASENETMSFIIGEYQNVEDVPAPEDGSVQVVEVPGGVFAAVEFSGYVTQGEAGRQTDRIVNLVRESKNVRLTTEDKPDVKFLVYNPPYTLPNLRRNEVLVAVKLEVEEY